MANLFFSYSHKDEELRNELEVHLSMLKREGLIDAWHDRRIPAGNMIDSEISSALEKADVILLLISAYFLASDYCFDVEMTRALQRNQNGTARVIPVILHPCDWHSAPFGNLRATPPDGKPISMFANRDEALSLVAKDIRSALSSAQKNKTIRPSFDQPLSNILASSELRQIRSSNLRVKRTFSDEEIDQFMEDTFEYIARFFESSLQELTVRNPQITTRFKRVDANSFTASIYDTGQRAAACTVWIGSRNSLQNGVAYSDGIITSRNQFNELLSVDNDGYSLHLRAMGMSMIGTNSSRALPFEGAAELFWGILIQRLQ